MALPNNAALLVIGQEDDITVLTLSFGVAATTR